MSFVDMTGLWGHSTDLGLSADIGGLVFPLNEFNCTTHFLSLIKNTYSGVHGDCYGVHGGTLSLTGLSYVQDQLADLQAACAWVKSQVGILKPVDIKIIIEELGQSLFEFKGIPLEVIWVHTVKSTMMIKYDMLFHVNGYPKTDVQEYSSDGWQAVGPGVIGLLKGIPTGTGMLTI